MEKEINFNLLMEMKNDFPIKFENVWTKFKSFCQGLYPYLLFEKIQIRNTDTFLLGCRPVKDASASTTLAMVRLFSENEIHFRSDADEEWVRLSDPSFFAQYLVSLLKNSFNQTQFNIMKSLNEKMFFEGFLCEDEPYDITSKSIKFKISSDESDKLFLLANEERVNELSSDVVVLIIPNDYPPTLSAYDARVHYSCFTFQGFLFEPQEIKDIGGNRLSFKGKFLRNMRM